MKNSYRILIVEDHKQLAENLFEYLGEEKYQLDYAADGLTALHLLATNTYDLIILDIMLPAVDGLTLCKRIREDLHSSIPVIMLTARDDIEDKTKAFNNGADDYLVKPFLMRELELRIQALCRRHQPKQNFIEAGEIGYYPGTLRATLSGSKDVILSGFNATIFELLIRQYPEFVSYTDLSQKIWGSEAGDPNTIRTHVYSLRKTLKESWGLDVIKTLHGRGYALQPF